MYPQGPVGRQAPEPHGADGLYALEKDPPDLIWQDKQRSCASAIDGSRVRIVLVATLSG